MSQLAAMVEGDGRAARGGCYELCVGGGVMYKDGTRGVRARRERCTDSARVPCENCRAWVDGVCEVTRAIRLVGQLYYEVYERQ